MELKKYKLGEIGIIVTGKTPSTKDIENFDGNIPFITPEDIAKGFIIKETKRYISEKGYNNIKNNTLSNFSILVGCIGSDMGNVAISEKKCATNQQINAITNIRESFCPLYIYYVLSTHKKNFRRLADSTTTPILPKSVFEDIEIFLPTFSIQRKIASVLSSLDDKIALNRRINAKLEQIAKRLYDYWFVQFDFPDKNGKPYKSSGGKMVWNEQWCIPNEWEIRQLDTILAKIDSGKRPAGGIDKKLKSGIPSLGAECIDALGTFNFSATPYIDYSFRNILTSGKIENNDILIYKDGAYVGKTTLFRDEFPYKEAYVNEHVFLIHANSDLYEEYLYFTLSNPTYFQVMQNFGKAKAAQPGLNKKDIQNILIIIPNEKVIKEFHHKIEPIFAQIFSNAKCIGKLEALRDRLLPLLMNGQVEVRE